MSPTLTVVTADASAAPTSETVGQRVRRLQAEARNLAKDHVGALSAGMGALAELATEIADGGDAYSPGVRDLARRLAEDLEHRGQTLDAINART